MNWFSQIFPCLSVRRVHDSVDVPDAATETGSASGRRLSAESQYVAERSPSVESFLSLESDYVERGLTRERLQLSGPPPRGQEETQYWLDNGNDAGVIAARDAADRDIRESICSEAGDTSYAPSEAAGTQRDFDRDQNGLPLFAIGSPGSAGPFTPAFPSAPPTKEAPSRDLLPQERPSLDITSSARSPPCSTVSTPVGGSRSNDGSQLDLPSAGAAWPSGAGDENFSDCTNALSLAAPKKNEVVEEGSGGKRGGVNSRRPVLHIDTQLGAPAVQPLATSADSPPEDGSQENDLPALPPSVSPSNHGSHEDDSPGLYTGLAAVFELGGLADGSSSSVDGCAGPPTTSCNNSDSGSMTSADGSRHGTRPRSPLESPATESPTESPAIDTLFDGDSTRSEASVDSPVSVPESPTIEELMHDITRSLDSMSESHDVLTEAPEEVDRVPSDDNSRSEVSLEPFPLFLMVNVF